MSARSITYALALFGLAGTLPARAIAQAPPLPPQGAAPVDAAVGALPGDAAANAEGMKVLEQGPIHEAFAEPVALDAKPLVTINRQPPDPINELPPDVKPEGNNVVWISGYWMWSDQQQDFIWVSGVWRDIPPGRRWVPGHWVNADGGGFQWVSGFWAAEQVAEVDLLPHPPASLEAGPSSPAPAANYFWVPGVWIYGDGGYAWRAGYWYAGQDNWVWVPDHYCYTPQGSIFVNGYWDYGLANRGLLYAPVWWSSPVYSRAGWYYRPYSVVRSSLLLSALFIHSRYNNFWYGYGNWRGDYIRPWWNYGYGGHWRGYNPFYAYHRWHDGHNHHDWDDHVRRDWDDRHRDWDRRRDGDWDRDRDRDWDRNRDGDALAGGGPGQGGRPGRPDADQPITGWRPDRLVANVDDLANQGVRIRKLDENELRTTQAQVDKWAQLRETRKVAEAKGRSINLGADLAAQTRGRGRAEVGNIGQGQTNIGGNVDANLRGRVDSRGPRVDAGGTIRSGGDVGQRITRGPQNGAPPTHGGVTVDNSVDPRSAGVDVRGRNLDQIRGRAQGRTIQQVQPPAGDSGQVRGNEFRGNRQIGGGTIAPSVEGPAPTIRSYRGNPPQIQGDSGGASRQIMRGNSGGSPNFRVPGDSGSGGPPAMIRGGGGESRSFRSGGSEMRSIESRGGGSSRSFRSSGGGGGGSEMRSFRSGGGGGGESRSFRGGGGGGESRSMRGGGGGGGGGRGKKR
jgi:hypothetical protein